jgi:hypothetical protein
MKRKEEGKREKKGKVVGVWEKAENKIRAKSVVPLTGCLRMS